MKIVDVAKVPPVQPTLESVTIELSVDDLVYVAAELAGGNSYNHPGTPAKVYTDLHDLIRRHGLATRYLTQQRIADVARVTGDFQAAQAMKREMFQC